MSSAIAAGRPGLTLGSYPQLSPPRDTRIERWARRRLATFRQRQRMTRARLDSVVARVLEAGESLERMPDEVLAMAISGLRVRFALGPDDEDLKVQVFAAIREVAGRTVGMQHFPSQIMGGWVLYHGMLAEMQTGEGKTLTATLAAGGGRARRHAGARHHDERLPGGPRRRADGPGVRESRPERRCGHR